MYHPWNTYTCSDIVLDLLVQSDLYIKGTQGNQKMCHLWAVSL